MDIDVRDVEVPMLMRFHRLFKAVPFLVARVGQRRNRPAWGSPRNTLDGLTATMSASIIM